jgi:hypothetical protein
MPHWLYERERESGDGFYEDLEQAACARKWLRKEADKSQDTFTRLIVGDLAWLEKQAEPFFLDMDYDEDLSDVDDMGPF